MLSDRRNIVVIADEAHRSQYDFVDGFAKHMRDALPKASFIGFTGTPIEKGDKNTQAGFGDYIDVYDIRQAKEGHATVPIYLPLPFASSEVARCGRRDAHATLKWIGSLAAVRGLGLVEKAVHGFAGEKFFAPSEVVALTHAPRGEQARNFGRGQPFQQDAVASSTVACSFSTWMLITFASGGPPALLFSTERLSGSVL